MLDPELNTEFIMWAGQRLIFYFSIKKIKLSQSQFLKNIKLMKKKLIWDLPVVDKKNILIGMLHLHPVVDVLTKNRNLI